MAFSTLVSVAAAVAAAHGPTGPRPGDLMLADYFRAETAALADRCLTNVKTLEEWTSHRETYRAQLFEMLGLSPLPERTPLRAEITGRIEHDGCSVEKVQFQSLPGLYVTGSLYLPKIRDPQPASRNPTVLYLCGHAPVVKDGVAYGSKAAYQHHGAWLARNGYVCLVIDTLQLGEIEGIHHGTHHEKMWWWNARGYTPAGVEAWNAIRALDYLQSRPEVDAERIGVTGRSGGGAYTWWVAALDERVQVAVPVAGITDLENHVVDGCVSGHCDCMYLVNTYRWDYPMVAALVAPRPLLISNSDKDPIFPLEGVVRVHAKVREIYRLYGATEKLGLQITEGPHKDTQELRLHALTWLNRHLKGEDPPIETTASKLFTPEQLKVFAQLPEDARNARIHETFVAAAPARSVPENAAAWTRQRDAWLEALREKVFHGWPADPGALELAPAFDVERNGIRLRAVDLTSQPHVRLRLYLEQPAGVAKPERMVLRVLDEGGWQRWLAERRSEFAAELAEEVAATPGTAAAAADRRRDAIAPGEVIACMAPRGVGRSAWDTDEKQQTHIRRRFMLLGQTLDGMRVWDVRRAFQALRAIDGLGSSLPLRIESEGQMAGVALYAALFEPSITALDLRRLPRSHRDGPDFLNVLRVLDLPQVVAMAAERHRVLLHENDPREWEYPAAVAARLGWPDGQLVVEK